MFGEVVLELFALLEESGVLLHGRWSLNVIIRCDTIFKMRIMLKILFS